MGKGGGGSGGGGGAQSGTQETIQREAPGVESRKLALYDEAVKLAQQPVTIPAYQVAGPTGLEQTGFQQAAVTGVGQPAVGQGIAGLQAGQQATNVGLGAALAGPNISQFFNPYQSYVTDEINRQAQIAQNQQAAQAVSAGAFGGGREGVQRAELDRARLEAIGQSRAQGFGTALQAAQNLQGLQAQTGLQAGAQFGQLGQALTGVGAQQQAMQQADIQSLLQAGGVQRALGQQALEAQRATSLAQQYEPYQRVEFLKNVMTNLPTGQSSITATTAPGSNPLAQAAGAGLGAYTAYNLLRPQGRKEGGLISIKKYQNGGEVKPTPKKLEGAFSDEERFALLAAPVIGSLLEGRTAPGQSNLQALLGSVGKGVSQIPETAIQIKKLDIAAQPKEKEQVRTLSPKEISEARLPTGTIAQIDSSGKVNIVSKPSDKQLEETENVVSTLSTLNRLKKDYVELGKPVGPFYNLDPDKIGGFLSGLVGGETGKKIQAFKATNADLSAKYKKAISGAAVSEPEAKRLEAVIPSDSDTEAVYEGKIRAMEDYLNTALKIKESQGLVDIKQAFGSLEKSGVSISNFYKPKEATDKYKFVDGVMKKVQ
jgi:hypothetical protein